MLPVNVWAVGCGSATLSSSTHNQPHLSSSPNPGAKAATPRGALVARCPAAAQLPGLQTSPLKRPSPARQRQSGATSGWHVV